MDDEDVNELESLYKLHGPAVLEYLRRLVGSDAEDLLHETFVRAAQYRGRVSAASSARAWLFGVARHVAISSLRRRRRSQPLMDQWAAAEQSEDPRLEVMRAAIERLPALQREALELRLRNELSYEEIAMTLEVPLGTVRSRLHAAVRQLRKSLCSEMDRKGSE